MVSCQEATPALVLVDDKQQTSIYLTENTSEPIRLAVRDFQSDIKKITGKQVAVADKRDSSATQVLVFNLANEAQRREAIQLHSDLDTLRGKWEAYVVQDVSANGQQHLIIAGSDERATIFAIYHFAEEYLGVSPTYLWSGLEPPQRDQLTWGKVRIMQDEPTFRFRGGFINDEDLLTEWRNGGGERNIDYRYYGQVVHPEVIQPVLETMLRLRLNLVIPASFVDIRNPPEERLVAEAAKRGLFVSMHHIEPLGVSAFAYQNYWKERGEEPLFSFYSERDKIVEVWQEYARRWAKYPNVIWQVGLRGIGDRPMWMADPGVPQSDAERGAIISEAIAVQKSIIDTLVRDPVLSTTLWAEGAGLNEQGYLSFPDSIIIVFADNSPGWKWQPDFYETKRNSVNNYGVYYHHQLWGSGPHLVQGVPPQKTYAMFQEAVSHGAADYAIMNISNVREFVLGLEASGQMLYNMDVFKPDEFQQRWFRQYFGEADEVVQSAYQAFFDSYRMHPQTKSPLLLDGQMRSYGLLVLRRLRQQITQPEAYQRERAARERSASETWGSRYLSDMHPANSLSPDELLPIVDAQLEKLETVGDRVNNAEKQLTDDSLRFFRANLAAQHQMLIGLNRWLRSVILSKLATDEGNPEAAATHLYQAIRYLQSVEEGKTLATEGKWQHWYRGDKKMNIADMIKQTKNTHLVMGDG